MVLLAARHAGLCQPARGHSLNGFGSERHAAAASRPGGDSFRQFGAVRRGSLVKALIARRVSFPASHLDPADSRLSILA
jgi:hypothetical protein